MIRILAVVYLSMVMSGAMAQFIEPIDPKATSKTKALYANLQLVSYENILFGHQDDLAYGVHWKNEPNRSDVKEVGGSYPAVYGWELGKLGEEVNIDGVSFEDMRRWIRQGYKRGGVITLSWHMDNLVSQGDSWDVTPAVSALLPGGDFHAQFLEKLDQFSQFVNKLKVGIGQKIPIIFRPFHENNGNWFWWGKGFCTDEEYQILWRFTVDYLKDQKQLHHLLYAYNTDRFSSIEEYLARYPGDDYVDILSFDDYHTVANRNRKEEMVNQLKIVTQLAQLKGKVAALSETGYETIPVPDWWTGTLLDYLSQDYAGEGIAYVMVWRNANDRHFYAPYDGHASAADFRSFRQHPLMLFEDDLPNLYKDPNKQKFR